MIQFFKCAFRNKISHGIGNLKVLKLILIDYELLLERPVQAARLGGRQRERGHELRRERMDRVRGLVRDLGHLGMKKNVGVRVVLEWIRPTGTTIPPYLVGEDVPEVRGEYDSGLEVADERARMAGLEKE